jgi:hypothetical protein
VIAYILRKTKSVDIVFNINHSLNRIKSRYSTGQFEDDIAIISHICENLSDVDKDIKMFKERMVDMINSNLTESKHYQELLSTEIDNGSLVNILDDIIEKRYNSINVLKQIKSKFIETSKEDNVLDNKDEKVTSNKLIKESYCIHLYDIQQKVDKPTDHTLENKINSVNISHFEIRKREQETRLLKDNLICELEEFQKENKTESATLEDLLNDNID